MRKFVEEHCIPHVDDWDKQRKVPDAFYRFAGREGVLAAVTGMSWPELAHGIRVPGNINPKQWNSFHTVSLRTCSMSTG